MATIDKDRLSFVFEQGFRMLTIELNTAHDARAWRFGWEVRKIFDKHADAEDLLPVRRNATFCGVFNGMNNNQRFISGEFRGHRHRYKLGQMLRETSLSALWSALGEK